MTDVSTYTVGFNTTGSIMALISEVREQARLRSDRLERPNPSWIPCPRCEGMGNGIRGPSNAADPSREPARLLRAKSSGIGTQRTLGIGDFRPLGRRLTGDRSEGLKTILTAAAAPRVLGCVDSPRRVHVRPAVAMPPRSRPFAPPHRVRARRCATPGWSPAMPGRTPNV